MTALPLYPRDAVVTQEPEIRRIHVPLAEGTVPQHLHSDTGIVSTQCLLHAMWQAAVSSEAARDITDWGDERCAEVIAVVGNIQQRRLAGQRGKLASHTAASC